MTSSGKGVLKMSNMSNTNNTSSAGDVHTARIRRKTVKRPLAIIVTIIMLLSSVVPIMAMADSSNGGGAHF
jgi:heme/copper-type cytochrome/quinol oxidase subunit 3